MAENSVYCKAYTANRFREFQNWSEDCSKLRKGRKEVDGKEIDYERSSIQDDDILYLHDSYVVTDGIFKDENIVFNNVSSEWKEFCTKTLAFSVPERRPIQFAESESSDAPAAKAS